MSLTIKPGVLDVTGAEAAKFLQAIVSSDVVALAVGGSQASLLLTPAGKIVSTLWITRTDVESFFIIAEKGKIDDVQESLSRLLIRTKATIENVSEKYSAHIRDLFATPQLTERDENASDDSDLYNELRISHGIVSSMHDVSDTIPQEANLDKNAVSFLKGCYLGQELVCRIDSREATTPFSFFATKSVGDDIGTVTSARQTDAKVIGDIECGPFIAIVRVPRKAVTEVSDSAAQPVSGYFTC